MNNRVAVAVLFVFAGLLQVTVAEARTVAEVLELMKVSVEPSEPLLPAGIERLDERPDATGRQVGEVDMVQGEVYVLPITPKVAYRVTKRQPVYAGDTLVTGDDGRVVLALEDESSVGLADYTRLRLTRIRFDASKRSRDSEVALDQGRARFRVSKVPGDAINFRVTTPAAIAGVRGSDFGVHTVSPEETCVLTADDTLLSVFGTAPVAAPEGASLLANQLVCSNDGVLGGVQTVGGPATPTLDTITPVDGLSSMAMPDHLFPIKRRH